MNRSARYLALILVSFLLLGCNPVQKVKDRKHTEDLDAAADTYRKLIRWGHFDQAVQYIKARDGSELVPDLAEVSRYKVNHYTITGTFLSEDLQEARVIATIGYVKLDNQVAKTMRDEQQWWYEPEAKRWHISSGLPDFRKAFRK